MVVVSSGWPCLIFATRCERALHELVVDRLLDERAARAGADLALVQREHREAFEALSKKSSSASITSAKKMFGDLPPSSSVHGNDVLGRVLHDQAAGRRLAGEGDLGDALVLRERLAGLDAEAVDDVEHAGRAGCRRSAPSAP